MRKAILIGIIGLLGVIGFQSCNVTRTVTTKSEYRQHGDTSIVIQTRTVESYDGTKKF